MNQCIEKMAKRRSGTLSGGLIFVLMTWLVCAFPLPEAFAASQAEIDRGVEEALVTLYATTPKAKEFSSTAKGILVFPRIVKAGFVVGAQYGEGALLKEGKTAGYYNTLAASYGLQIGAQTFGYALFFMSESSLEYLAKSDGWEIGVGPTVVVVDAGMAKSLTSTTIKEGIYAFFFNQKGLMAGMGLQGSKIEPFQPDK